MSGISTSGGGGDVTLAGNPNAFTGTNTYDVNRPTSSLTSTPAATEFITKQDADGDYALLDGGTTLAPQTFAGVNEFDEDVTISGEGIEFTNGTRRVIDMTNTPTASNSNKLLMTAPKTEISQIATGSVNIIDQKNEIVQTAQNSAINIISQTGIATTTNLISQTGANSTITTDGKFTTATAPTSGTHLCNKTYVDAVTTGAFAQNTQAHIVVTYVVGGGNPTASSGGDNLNGRMEMPSHTQGSLEVEITTPPSNASVKIDFSIFGEWDADGWDKGIILARAAQAADGSFTYTSLLRADGDATAPVAVKLISTFTNNYTRDASTTPEQAIGFFIDHFVVAGTTYRYIPVLVNAAVTGSNHTFKLNRPITNSNLSFAERGCSAITATILNV